MGVRLPPGEAERRRKARVAASFSDDAYKHYNPRKEGFGSSEDWARIAEALSAGRGALKAGGSRISKDMEWLGLTEMPADVSGLKKAFRNACFVHHPDHGGSELAFQSMYAAYERLMKQY